MVVAQRSLRVGEQMRLWISATAVSMILPSLWRKIPRIPAAMTLLLGPETAVSPSLTSARRQTLRLCFFTIARELRLRQTRRHGFCGCRRSVQDTKKNHIEVEEKHNVYTFCRFKPLFPVAK